jgi:hypothetical protein
MAPKRRALEIFLSLGASAGMIAAALGDLPPGLAQPSPHGAMHHQEGGEGGEGGEGSSTSERRSDAELLLVLAQMQGHLLVAGELLAKGQLQAAEPHVGHPVDELYGALQPAIAERRISPFLPVLEDLRQQVRIDPAATSTAKKLAAARQAVAAAARSLPASAASDPASVMALVRQLAATASDEYGAAVAEGLVVEVIEYQDARGFLLEAQQLLQATKAADPATAARLQRMAQGIVAMLKAVPTAVPPQKAWLSPEQLEQLQKQL